MADQFLAPPPKGFEDIEGAEEWARAIILTFNELLSPDGVLDTVDETLVEQGADLIAVATQVDTNTASLSGLQNSLPVYTIGNDTTDRTLNANSAAGAISDPPTQAEVENVRNALLAQADILATVINDLANKDIVGT